MKTSAGIQGPVAELGAKHLESTVQKCIVGVSSGEFMVTLTMHHSRAHTNAVQHYTIQCYILRCDSQGFALDRTAARTRDPRLNDVYRTLQYSTVLQFTVPHCTVQYCTWQLYKARTLRPISFHCMLYWIDARSSAPNCIMRKSRHIVLHCSSCITRRLKCSICRIFQKELLCTIKVPQQKLMPTKTKSQLNALLKDPIPLSGVPWTTCLVALHM